MKMVKATGLVPVKAVKNVRYRPGTIFGLPPSKIQAALDAGEVSLDVEIPANYETVDVPDPRNMIRSSRAEEQADEPKDGEIAIPDDWRELHHFKRIAIAKELHPEHEGKWTAEMADEAIEHELKRRAKQSGNEDAPGDEAVEIPEDWRALDAEARVALATKIDPDHGDWEVEAADAAIGAEVERRAAADAAGA